MLACFRLVIFSRLVVVVVVVVDVDVAVAVALVDVSSR